MRIQQVADVVSKHKGKTVSASALVAAIPLLVSAGLISSDDVMPATRAYVAQQITQQTRGVAFLVKRGAELDVDNLWYAVTCMRKYELQGSLTRSIEEFKTLTGEPYQVKTCEQLEAQREVRK